MKKALITMILGKDLSAGARRRALRRTEIFENETFEVLCTPDLNAACDDVTDVFSIVRHPDVSLLVMQDGFSETDVLSQMEKLQTTTGKPPGEFIIMLPLLSGPGRYPFRVHTVGEVFTHLTKLAEERAAR